MRVQLGRWITPAFTPQGCSQGWMASIRSAYPASTVVINRLLVSTFTLTHITATSQCPSPKNFTWCLQNQPMWKIFVNFWCKLKLCMYLLRDGVYYLSRQFIVVYLFGNRLQILASALCSIATDGLNCVRIATSHSEESSVPSTSPPPMDLGEIH